MTPAAILWPETKSLIRARNLDLKLHTELLVGASEDFSLALTDGLRGDKAKMSNHVGHKVILIVLREAGPLKMV